MADEPPRTTADPDDDACAPHEDLVQDLLVEEISIDGMCGVY